MNDIKKLRNIPFFYILSMGRSGSTLLEFLLDAHPNVNIPLESRFIIHLYYKYHSKTKWTTKEKEEFLSNLFQDKKMVSSWEIDKKKLESDILSTDKHISFFDLCRIVTSNYISIYDKSEIEIQGSKNPIYSLWCDVLYQLNSQSKFIHLIRSPLGVVASHKKSNNSDLLYYAFRWNFINAKIEKLKKKKPESFITIKYEDLISAPEGTLKKICSFLGIDYSSELLKFNEKVRSKKVKVGDPKLKSSLEDTHLRTLIRPIDSTIGNSWQKVLTPEEIINISSITYKMLHYYGFNPSKKGPFKIQFIIPFFKVKYKYLRQRVFYRFSLSIVK